MDVSIVTSMLLAAVAAVGSSGIAAVLARIARRSAEPTGNQIVIAEREVQAAWDAGGGPGAEGTTTTPPTSAGHNEAIAILAEYAQELRAEAGRIAQRAGADQPSATHVRIAADRVGILRARAGAVADIMLAIGSILLGAAISYGVNLWTGGTPAEGTQVYAVIALAVGVALCTWAATMKWTKS